MLVAIGAAVVELLGTDVEVEETLKGSEVGVMSVMYGGELLVVE